MKRKSIGPNIESETKTGFPGRNRWNEEYNTNKAIPSSQRSSPSKALVAANAAIDYSRVSSAVDIGCGNGRNSIYLANCHVNTVALDFSDKAIELAKNRIASSGLSEFIDLVKCEVSEGLPLKAYSRDLVIDSYTSCHFISQHILTKYFNDVERVLNPGGKLYWSALSSEDGYYAGLSDTHPEDNVIVDPLNGLPKRLYQKSEIRSGLPTNLEVKMTFEISFEGVVDGDRYLRSIIAGVFEK